jgi:hypothetical protein
MQELYGRHFLAALGGFVAVYSFMHEVAQG